jgi:hypothetical protein
MSVRQAFGFAIAQTRVAAVVLDFTVVLPPSCASDGSAVQATTAAAAASDIRIVENS